MTERKETKNVKKGDFIHCHDHEYLKQTLRDLGEHDVNAVVWDPVKFILIVKVKGEENGENETMSVLRK